MAKGLVTTHRKCEVCGHLRFVDRFQLGHTVNNRDGVLIGLACDDCAAERIANEDGTLIEGCELCDKPAHKVTLTCEGQGTIESHLCEDHITKLLEHFVG